MPLGAIIARDTVMDWPSGSHASTFGGNPVSCRASLATLELLEGGYTANAAERGRQLQDRLRAMQKEFPILAHVRGLGLMTAVDVVKEDDQQTPDPGLRDHLIQAAFHEGLLLLGCGETAIRFCPPLCITAEQIDAGLAILKGLLEERTISPAAVA
jgi:4-aminobutyrate aminotransferase